MISFKPSMIWSNSRRDTAPIFLPILSDESVRIWLIFSYEQLTSRSDRVQEPEEILRAEND